MAAQLILVMKSEFTICVSVLAVVVFSNRSGVCKLLCGCVRGYAQVRELKCVCVLIVCVCFTAGMGL